MFTRLNLGRKNTGAPEFLVVGLGNPEKRYTLTRHNSGFLCVDELAERHGFKINKLKFKAVCADTVISGHRVIVMKPQTYMNNSGEAVREAAAFYKIPPEKIIIIFDDISLDVGLLRIKRKGSDGGHNGIKSIISQLGSSDFPRIKLGVGKKPHPDYDLADWVLSEFKKEEAQPLKQAIDSACEAVVLLLDGEIDEAMNRYNS
ncbi:MAG: aminoacyl-tRNA hydrolase [Clostridia bacterium]|nr:aminoacyl-tRNA hydrolase [Clostridia bacterium]